jgi:hypothetical protein
MTHVQAGDGGAAVAHPAGVDSEACHQGGDRTENGCLPWRAVTAQPPSPGSVRLEGVFWEQWWEKKRWEGAGDTSRIGQFADTAPLLLPGFNDRYHLTYCRSLFEDLLAAIAEHGEGSEEHRRFQANATRYWGRTMLHMLDAAITGLTLRLHAGQSQTSQIAESCAMPPAAMPAQTNVLGM